MIQRLLCWLGFHDWQHFPEEIVCRGCGEHEWKFYIQENRDE